MGENALGVFFSSPSVYVIFVVQAFKLHNPDGMGII